MNPDESPPRRIEYVSLDELKPASVNPKSHDLDEIATSIGRFGYVLPGAVDERTGLLVAGHGRHEALAQMRDRGDRVPEGVTTDDAGRWLVPLYRGWSSRDDDEAAAYLVADNELTMRGGWIRDSLADVLLGVQQSPAGLAGTGYTDDSLSAMLQQLGRTAPSFEPTDDAAPRLDKVAPDIVECPHCGQSFDVRAAR